MDEDEKIVINNVDEDMVFMMFVVGIWYLEYVYFVSV